MEIPQEDHLEMLSACFENLTPEDMSVEKVGDPLTILKLEEYSSDIQALMDDREKYLKTTKSFLNAIIVQNEVLRKIAHMQWEYFGYVF